MQPSKSDTNDPDNGSRMDILILGGTGFVGRALVPALQRKGHRVTVWTRRPEAAVSLLGAETRVLAETGDNALANALRDNDAVINLAGAPILGWPWTNRRKQILSSSRRSMAQRVMRALCTARGRSRVLLSASAVWYYGDRGHEELVEASPPGHDFLAALCTAWEQDALACALPGVRVAVLRMGFVLGREGGALAPLLPMFRSGVGATLGDGAQYMSWPHLHDLVRIVTASLTDERFSGPINCVAPAPVTNRVFTHMLSASLGRTAVLRIPSTALRLILGQASSVALSSQRVRPARLEQLRFPFAFPTLASALPDIVGTDDVKIQRAAAGPVDTYLAQRPPRYELRTTTRLHAPVDEAFAFFSSARNLGLITPTAMMFRIVDSPPSIEEGSQIRYRLRIGLVPMQWLTRICRWEPGRRFVDVQESGPYRLWWHEHTFRAEGDRTLMQDRVLYTPPLGIVGRICHGLVIAPMLRRIFAYRGHVIRLRFGGDSHEADRAIAASR